MNAVRSQLQYDYAGRTSRISFPTAMRAFLSNLDAVLFCLSLIHINHERCARARAQRGIRSEGAGVDGPSVTAADGGMG